MHVRTTCIPSLAQAGTTPNLMLLVVTSCYPGIFHAIPTPDTLWGGSPEGWIGGLDGSDLDYFLGSILGSPTAHNNTTSSPISPKGNMGAIRGPVVIRYCMGSNPLPKGSRDGVHPEWVVRRVGSEGWIGGLDLRKTSCGVLMCCIHSHHHTGILVCCVG